MKSLEKFDVEEAKNKTTKTVSAKSDGFVIQAIELKGFMRYADKTVIKFPEKLTVIVGRTGSGKTTILDAITFALYKKSLRTDVGVELDNICARNGYVKLFFSLGGNNYELERGIKSDGKSYVNLKFNGKALHDKISELDAKIRDIIGLDYVGFRNSTFIRQEEMKQLGAEIGSERLAIFQKLFRLEIFAKAQDNAGKRIKKLDAELSTLQGEIDADRKRLEKIPERERELVDAEPLIKSLKKELDVLDNEIKDKEREKAELAKSHEEYIGTREKLNYTAVELKKTARKIAEREQSAQAVLKLKSEITKLERETADYEDLKNKGEQLRELELVARNVQNEKTILENQRTQIEKDYEARVAKVSNELNELQKRLSSISTDIDKDKAFSLLRTEGTLTERINRIKKELTWNLEKSLIAELNTEQKNAVTELDKASKDVARINADSFVLSEIKKQIEKLEIDTENEKRAFDERIHTQNSSIAEKDKQLQELVFDDEKRKRLSELRSTLPEKDRKRKYLENKRIELQDIGDLSKVIEDSKLKLEELERVSHELELKITGLKLLETKYSQIESELKQLQDERSQVSSKIASTQTLHDRIKLELTELKDLERQVAANRKEVTELNERLEILTALKEEIFHSKGIVMYAINQLLPALAIKTARNLADMTDNRFSQVRIQTYEETYGHGVRIEVCGVDNAWHDIKEFSGGEKTQINAALRFAIAEELASLPQVGRTYGRMKMLFIDEGDLGALDTEISRELFVRKLFDMERFFDKIILITHLTDIADKFPARLHVSMSPEGISRIEVQR